MLSSGLKTSSRNKVKGGDKEQHIRLWIEKCQRDFVRLVLFHISLMISRREQRASSQTLQMILNEEALQILDRTENNSLEELEIMEKTQLNYLYFDKSELICPGKRKPTWKKYFSGMSEAGQRLKLRIREGNKLDRADVMVVKWP